MPSAARVRTQPRLLPEEWEVPIRNWQDMGPAGGVAICPKECLPQVLEKVGYTSKAAGILVAQDPDTLGCKSYPRTRVMRSDDVDCGAGERTVVPVERYLVQALGSPW